MQAHILTVLLCMWANVLNCTKVQLIDFTIALIKSAAAVTGGMQDLMIVFIFYL